MPPAFRDVPLAPPPIAANTGAHVTQWTTVSNGSATLALGCVATPVPGWVEDMRPAVEARTVALAGKAAGLVANEPLDARSAGDLFDLRPASHLDGPILGSARTFVGFDASRVFTCFATCAARPDAAAASEACRSAVTDATLAGSLAPPPPGVGLRAVTWGVHHPRETAFGGAAALAILATFAVVCRRRPRFSG